MSRLRHGATPPRRDGYHHGDLRRALIQAGRELLEERGVEALGLREVARRAQVSHAAPYHHFAGKEDLVAAIVLSGFEDFLAALQGKDPHANSSALDRMTEMGLAYVQFAVRRPALFRLLMRPELWGEARNGPGAEAMDRAASAAYQMLRDSVHAALEEGSIEGSVDDVTVAALSVVHGLSTLLVDGPLDLSARSPERLSRAVLRALGAGIIRRGPGP